MKVRFNKEFNINRLIKRIIFLIVGLLIGGLILAAFVDAFVGYCSPFFNGLSIIGVNISQVGINATTWGTSTIQADCLGPVYGGNFSNGTLAGSPYAIGTGGLNGGILTVVGLIGVAGIVMAEFVRW